MNTKRTRKLTPFLLETALALAVALAITLPVTAESTAELLEKGIYTEQTVGDLKAAIDIYTQVVENAEANRPHVAQAHFRLGLCHLKQGNDAEARAVFDKLIREFPEQDQLVAQAREQLAAARPSPTLAPAPWEDGEFLLYRMSLPTGKEVGTMYLGAESTVVDGIEAWRLELRRFVAVSADNYGVSQILVDRHTQRPIRSTIRHGVFGNADAAYGPDAVEVTGGPTARRLDSRQEVYDNDQSMHLMRTLPLELGYKGKLSLLPIWTANIIETGFEVTGEEDCRVPAGDFHCFAITFDIGQTTWYSTGPERYPVKVEGGGVVIELAEIGRRDSAASTDFGLKDFGFSGSLPPGWLTHEFHLRANKAMIRLLDPEAASLSSIEVDRCPRGQCPSLQETAKKELAGARRRIEDYEQREGSWTERTIDDRPAISFLGDYTQGGKPWVQYRLYTFVDKVRLEFIFRTPADRFEGLQATFDAVAESLRAE